MIPIIEYLDEKKLVGKRMTISFANYRTSELWKSFMPRLKEIVNHPTSDLISMAIYEPTYFANFLPQKEFEKWADVEVSDFECVPNDMETFTLAAGL